LLGREVLAGGNQRFVGFALVVEQSDDLALERLQCGTRGLLLCLLVLADCARGVLQLFGGGADGALLPVDFALQLRDVSQRWLRRQCAQQAGAQRKRATAGAAVLGTTSGHGFLNPYFFILYCRAVRPTPSTLAARDTFHPVSSSAFS